MQAHRKFISTLLLLKKLLKNVFHRTKGSEQRRRKTRARDPIQERDEGSLQNESERKSQHESSAPGQSTASQDGRRKLEDPRWYVSRGETDQYIK